MGEKRCTTCHTSLPGTTQFFYLHRNAKLRPDCKVCVRSRSAEWRRNNHRPCVTPNESLRRRCQLHARLLEALHGELSAFQLLGCSPEWAIRHVTRGGELTFTGRRIDHIIPLSRYDLSSREDQRRSCNWRNLQLVTEETKGDELPDACSLFLLEDLWPTSWRPRVATLADLDHEPWRSLSRPCV